MGYRRGETLSTIGLLHRASMDKGEGVNRGRRKESHPFSFYTATLPKFTIKSLYSPYSLLIIYSFIPGGFPPGSYLIRVFFYRRPFYTRLFSER